MEVSTADELIRIIDEMPNQQKRQLFHKIFKPSVFIRTVDRMSPKDKKKLRDALGISDK